MTIKNFKPLVSVVIPVYNGANYVKQAIDSVLNQTYDNIEIIIVNDGSNDNSEQIIKKYGNKVKYYSKKNGGVATALNLAIKKSNGEYISWLSHDDLYLPNKVQSNIDLLLTLEKSKRNKTILYSNYISIDENSKIISTSVFHKQHHIEKLNSQLYPLFNGLIHGCSLLIPKQCFVEIGLFNPKLKSTQDYDLWFKMFPHYELKFIEAPTIKSRCHSEQDSKKHHTPIECDELWINMIKGITKEQMVFMSGGVLPFYINTLKVVSSASYLRATKYIEQKISEYRSRNPNDIKVSVIMPFFNRIDWVIEAINSVINQTHTNLELILVNDNSSEDISPITDITKNDKRVILLSNVENFGAANARNIGIERGTGEYIAFIDSDDLFYKEKISLQLEYMLQNDLMICHTSYELVDEKLNFMEQMNVGMTDYKFPETIKSCLIATPTIMAHRDVFADKSNRFQIHYNYGEDTCLWITLSEKYSIKGYHKNLSRVRQHESQTVLDENKMIQGLTNIVHYSVINHLNENSVSSIYYLNSILLNLIISRYSIDVEKINPKGFKAKIKNIINKILLLFPTYRKLQSLQYSIKDNNNKIVDLTRQIGDILKDQTRERQKIENIINDNSSKIKQIIDKN